MTTFAKLHVKGNPVLLYNAWDAGSAKAIARAGAPAIATSSWAIAAAHGHADGESIPLTLVHEIVRRIASAVDVPVTMDFEGGYGATEAELAANARALLDLGIAGINFEDRVMTGAGLLPIEVQARRIAAIRAAVGPALFINARTDLFFGRGAPDPKDSMADAIERAAAYAAAGASGLFVPGIKDERLIAELAEKVALPLNVLVVPGAPPPARLGELGVARVSWGHVPYVEAMAAVERAAKAIY